MNVKKIRNNLMIEDAEIGFRNFSGAVGPYNKNGEKSFCVFLDNDMAEQLEEEGWNIKWPKERDDILPEEDTRKPYFNVKVEFGDYPPKCIMIANEVVTQLDELGVAQLDTAEIEKVDIILNPYNWSVNGKSGIKAYLNSIYVTIVTNDFIERYGI